MGSESRSWNSNLLTSRRTRAAVKPVAVVDIGATSIRMAIGEIDEEGGVRTLESLSQAVSLGMDTFSERGIRKSTIEDCVRVLKSYRKILEEYEITDPEHIRVVATSAVREARNRLAFIDRVYIATGLEVEPIDEAEVNRVTYLGVQPHLQDSVLCQLPHDRHGGGGGSTELLLVHDGNVSAGRHVPPRLAAPAQVAGRLPRLAGQSPQDHGEPDSADGR